MTIEKAIKKYKLEPLNAYTKSIKAKELNVDEVLYMHVDKNKYAYIVKNGSNLYLYSDEKSLYTKMYKGLKIDKLEE